MTHSLSTFVSDSQREFYADLTSSKSSHVLKAPTALKCEEGSPHLWAAGLSYRWACMPLLSALDGGGKDYQQFFKSLLLHLGLVKSLLRVNGLPLSRLESLTKMNHFFAVNLLLIHKVFPITNSHVSGCSIQLGSRQVSPYLATFPFSFADAPQL